MDADNREKILNHYEVLMRNIKPWSWCLKIKNHHPLRDLIERIERQYEQEKEAWKGLHHSALEMTSSHRRHNPPFSGAPVEARGS